MSGPALPVCCGLVVSGKQIVDEGLYILKLAKHHLHVCHSHSKLDGQYGQMDTLPTDFPGSGSSFNVC